MACIYFCSARRPAPLDTSIRIVYTEGTIEVYRLSHHRRYPFGSVSRASLPTKPAAAEAWYRIIRRVCDFVCVYLRAPKGKRLELSSPKTVVMYSVTGLLTYLHLVAMIDCDMCTRSDDWNAVYLEGLNFSDTAWAIRCKMVCDCATELVSVPSE